MSTRFRLRQTPLLLLVLWLLLVSAACSGGGDRALGVYLRANEEQLEQSASVDDRPVRFVVEPGTSAREIGRQLEAGGLIRDALLFEAYIRVNGLGARLEAGTFVLTPAMTIPEIAAALQNARAASITVTVPEGWRAEQIADYLADANVFGDLDQGASALAEQYRTRVLTGDLSGLDPSRYLFLQDRPAGASLEGYLFPDTYELPAQVAQADEMLTRQLDAFAGKVAPLYAEAVAAGDTDRSLFEVLTIASIVEREAVVPEERPAIAGVYLNRLEMGMRLEADPTVQYAMGYQEAADQWWKTPVFLEEYSSVDSPYNTYLYGGLPPGPT